MSPPLLNFLGTMIRARFLLPFIGLVLLFYTARFASEGPPIYGTIDYAIYVIYDYVVWINVFIACVVTYIDIKHLGSKFSYASSLLLEFSGLIITIAGRVFSLMCSQMVCTPYCITPLFGSLYTYEGFMASFLCTGYGLMVIGATSIIHSLIGKPLVFHRSIDMISVLVIVKDRLVNVFTRVWSHGWFYLVLSFLMGFIYRLGPEIVWWPWLVGWDTVEYVAHLMDFMEKLNPFTGYHWMGSTRNIPPLLNILLSPMALAIGTWNTFKLYPPLAYGLLTLSSALVARRVFELSGFKAFLVATTTTFFVVNLRISWDYHRQLLGSVFMLFSIAVLDSQGELSTRKILAGSLLLIACSLSHEVTAFFSITLSLALIYVSLKYRNTKGLVAGLAVFVVSTGLEIWYWGKPYTRTYVGITPVGIVSTSPNEASEVIGYLMAGFGLLLPLAILKLFDGSSNSLFLKTGLFFLLIAGLTPLFAPYTSVAVWYRFLAGAAPLISTLAGAYIAKTVKDWRPKLLFILLLLLIAFPYAYGVTNTLHYTRALREFPHGLTPAPGGVIASDLASLVEWLKKSNLENLPIIAEPDAARWIHLVVRNPSPDKLIWSEQLTSRNVSASYVLEVYNLSKAYIACSCSIVDHGEVEIYKLKEGIYNFYLVEATSKNNQRVIN